jgi:hypothetical protein
VVLLKFGPDVEQTVLRTRRRPDAVVYGRGGKSWKHKRVAVPQVSPNHHVRLSFARQGWVSLSVDSKYLPCSSMGHILLSLAFQNSWIMTVFWSIHSLADTRLNASQPRRSCVQRTWGRYGFVCWYQLNTCSCCSTIAIFAVLDRCPPMPPEY